MVQDYGLTALMIAAINWLLFWVPGLGVGIAFVALGFAIGQLRKKKDTMAILALILALLQIIAGTYYTLKFIRYAFSA